MNDFASSRSPRKTTTTDGVAQTAQDDRYLEVVALYGSALQRLAHGYESDPSRRQDLLQDIHVALWRSLAIFDGRCSLRTWVYRVAHHNATKHIVADRRVRLREMHTLDDVPDIECEQPVSTSPDHADSLQQLQKLIDQLKPLDRQVILMYLEDLAADAISEVVGLSTVNIATKIHRIKKLLASMFHERDTL